MKAMSDHDNGIDAAEAAARLGVKRQTLYAYVSRGLIGRTVSSDGHTSLFDPAEVARLADQRRPGSRGELRTIMSTSITNVGRDSLVVRGYDLIHMVNTGARFTEVVNLLWESTDQGWPSVSLEPAILQLASSAARHSPFDGLRMLAANASASDPLRHDLSPNSIRSAGRRLIVSFATGLGGEPTVTPESETAMVAGALWQALSPIRDPDPQMVDALDTALALMADHGLASSTFAARVAASVRADPYSVVSAGLGALSGPLHGQAGAAVHHLWGEATGPASPTAIHLVGEAYRRDSIVPGFGHSVYRHGDPRFEPLMAAVNQAWPDNDLVELVSDVTDLVKQRSGIEPNVDLALGTLAFLADMPPSACEVIFAVARTAGWLAHAMEEYKERPLRFRTQARYVGP